MGRSETFKRKHGTFKDAVKRKPETILPTTPPAEPPLTVHYTPKNDRQIQVRDVWDSVRLLILTGPAGCGKTSAAIGEAMTELLAGRTKKVMLARPLVSNDENIGFLPGTVEEKVLPWLGAFNDCLGNLCNKKLDKIMDRCEFVPVGMLRGRTVSNATLIVDESQNCTFKQLECAGTRVGRGGRVVLCGDPDQSDIRETPNPLAVFAETVKRVPGVLWVKFEAVDQVRDPFVTELLKSLSKKRR